MRPFLVTFYRTVKVLADKEYEAEKLAREAVEGTETGYISLYSMNTKIVDLKKVKK